MSVSYDRQVDIGTTPTRLLTPNPMRWSWYILNTGSVTFYYKRGSQGSTVATSGSAIGIPVTVGGADGWDEDDAQDEVWAIAASATVAMLSETVKAEGS
ncbi:hypothetical protein D4R30_00375 [archaeon]|nr:MAG: hypothetical protein D4R30_00375 [archaeon]